MKLITEAQYAALLANGRAACTNCDIDPKPVVKLFTPGGYSRWLLTEIDPLSVYAEVACTRGLIAT